MLGRSGLVGLVAAVAVVFGSAVPAAAVEPDCKQVSGSFTSAPTLVPTIRTLSGTVAPFGKVQGLLVFTSMDATGGFTGFFILFAKDGAVMGTVEGQFFSANQYVEEITLTSGTGAYLGITGEATLIGTLNADGTAVDEIQSGRVCFPD